MSKLQRKKIAKTVAVIAAHPDDEILGCGATIAKHIKNGDEVHVLILAEGLTSRLPKRDRDVIAEELNLLAVSAKEANDYLGVSSLNLHNFPDNRMDSLELINIVKVIENFISKYKPQVVYTHHCGDVNIDHRLVSQSVVVACRPIPNSVVERILFFEVASSTEWQPQSAFPSFHPNWFVDVTQTLDQKLAALVIYKDEMRSWPHPRSVQALEHLARWRGSTVGVEAAEAFILGRNTDR
ncbi:MAG: hypothetical protein ACD_46C00181G0022 [uncultured bacterium]|nr:MAG: hypothetical protein ACD_46C00181G0022 [uncultured bacterium]